MVPDNEPVSAFAVFSGQNGLSKKKKKKKKPQTNKNDAVPLPIILSKEQKKKIIQEKKAKKNLILNKKSKLEPLPKQAPSEVPKNKKKKKKKKTVVLKAVQLTDKKKSSMTVDVQVAEKKKEAAATKGTVEPKVKKKKVKGPKLANVPVISSTPKHEADKQIISPLSLGEKVRSIRKERQELKTMSKRKMKKTALYHQVKEIAQQKNSFITGKETLQKLISPIPVDDFMRDFWEKAPIHIPATNSEKFNKLINTPMIDEILRSNILMFTKDLDVTSYIDGERETHNQEGRAQAHVVWDFYSDGCSVRLLSPQSYSPGILTLNSALQEYFSCFVGANVYLTPPSSQGFAPHYDDIEAFVLQVEGKKKWQVYAPRNKNEVLPRYSSKNFKPQELHQEPILEVILNPGDVLYFPRGFIHQAQTVHNQHSLHITISAYQKTAWCDLLEKAVPLALEKAIANDVEYRKGLPIGYLGHAGLGYKNVPERKNVIHNLKKLMSKLLDYIDVDGSVDLMGVQYMHDALPPILSSSEAECSIVSNGMVMEANGRLKNHSDFKLDTSVRLLRKHCSRFVQEMVTTDEGTSEMQYRLYFSVDNPKQYHMDEPQFVIIPNNMVPSMKYLISSYPSFVPIADFPSNSNDDKLVLAADLWVVGVLITDKPFEDDEHDGTIADTLKSMEQFSKDTDEEDIPGDDDEEDDDDGDDDDGNDEIEGIMESFLEEKEIGDENIEDNEDGSDVKEKESAKKKKITENKVIKSAPTEKKVEKPKNVIGIDKKKNADKMDIDEETNKKGRDEPKPSSSRQTFYYQYHFSDTDTDNGFSEDDYYSSEDSGVTRH